jgi:hypothetical protein
MLSSLDSLVQGDTQHGFSFFPRGSESAPFSGARSALYLPQPPAHRERKTQCIAAPYVAIPITHETDIRGQMNNALLPSDIEYFLLKLGTMPTVNPAGYMQYARVVASLLYDKYVILGDASLEILPVAKSVPAMQRPN